MDDQREMVERSLARETGDGRTSARWPRHRYTSTLPEARTVERGSIVSTQFGAYWQVLTKTENETETELLLDAVRPQDPRTHNSVVTMLFGGILM
jgi:hypothetical protein